MSEILADLAQCRCKCDERREKEEGETRPLLPCIYSVQLGHTLAESICGSPTLPRGIGLSSDIGWKKMK